MSSTENELTLTSRAVAGDTAALELLFFRHRDRLDAFIKAHFPRELRGAWEPHDILQDVWIQAMRGIREFGQSDSDSIRRWLLAIARNTIADRLKYMRAAKRKGVRIDTSQRGDNNSIMRLLEELALYRRTPSKSAANHELLVALDSALSRLVPAQATALQLRYLAGLEVKQVAQKMHRSAASVSMLCRRGLDSLRLELRSMSLYV